MGAGADDVAVGKELTGLFVVGLKRGLYLEPAVVVETAEEFRRSGGMDVGRGARIYVKRNSQPLHGVFYYLVVTVNDILRSDALFAGLDCDGDSVFIASADKKHLFATHSEEAGVDVGRDIYTGQMTYVDRSVGVGQSGGYERTFELLFHIFRGYLLTCCLISRLNCKINHFSPK